MRSESISVAFEAWNMCNGAEVPAEYRTWFQPSPQMADCILNGTSVNAITAFDNSLAPGDGFPGSPLPNTTNVNEYSILKQVYLGGLCQQASLGPVPGNWSFWKVMFKNGNFNQSSLVCNATSLQGTAPGTRAHPVTFNNLPMNQPLMTNQFTLAGQPLPYGGVGSVGYFAGTYDIQTDWTPAEVAAMQQALHNYTQAWYEYRINEIAGLQQPEPSPPPLLAGASFLSTLWYQNVTSGSWVFYNVKTTSDRYPWLMNYLRSDSVAGGSGGAPWDGRGVMMQHAQNALGATVCSTCACVSVC